LGSVSLKGSGSFSLGGDAWPLALRRRELKSGEGDRSFPRLFGSLYPGGAACQSPPRPEGRAKRGVSKDASGARERAGFPGFSMNVVEKRALC
jgi:hypothetical protein